MNCHHFDSVEIEDTTSAAYGKGCAECIAMDDSWVHLRECLDCGHVGCCDASKNKHATKHFHTSKHPVIRSVEPGEQWGWCYIDEVMVGLE
ncbi:MAG: UBP-type zinc finger domain-containing protein [Acidobacteriaceae bacterium]|nr:UBP-type zinc finger domain-containing protein [Acidobacteriaceae bacterium]